MAASTVWKKAWPAFGVDNLKHINDSYGYQAGDACLRHVADVIAGNTRRGDWLARWGGDEFVLVLRDARPMPQNIIEHIVGVL